MAMHVYDPTSHAQDRLDRVEDNDDRPANLETACPEVKR
jgi:hypothetical protein